jgi:hypothetical protein
MNTSTWKGVVLAAVALLVATSAGSQPVWNVEIVGGLDLTQLRGDDTDASLIFADEDIGSGEVAGDIGGTKFGFVAGVLVTV